MLSDPAWRKRHDELAGPGSADLLARITVNVGTIEGGSSASVIAPDCVFSATVVTPVGADPYKVFSKAREMVSRYPEATFEWEGAAVADVSDPGHEMASILQDTVQGLGRIRPEMTPAIAISDCRYWRYRGVPAFWYGPDGSLCSAANESVEIDELLHVVRTYTLAAVRYLNAAPAAAPRLPEPEPSRLAAKPEIRALPSVRVARVIKTVADFKAVETAVGPMMGRLYSSLSNADVIVGEVCFATYEMTNEAVIITAAIQVGSDIGSGEGFEVVDLPSVEAAACVVHRGDLDAIGSTWDRLRRWIRRQGYRPIDVYRETYVIGEPNPRAVWATELQQVVAKR